MSTDKALVGRLKCDGNKFQFTAVLRHARQNGSPIDRKHMKLTFSLLKELNALTAEGLLPDACLA